MGRLHPRRLATTPLELANAYATLAADGKYCEPIPVQEILDPEGKKLDIAQPRCEQVVSAPRWPGPRSTRPAARSATAPTTSKCNGQATAGNVTRHRRQRRWPARPAPPTAEKTATLVADAPSSSRSPGILADPDWPQTNQRMDHETTASTRRSYETLRDAMKGKKAHQLHAAERQDRLRRSASPSRT